MSIIFLLGGGNNAPQQTISLMEMGQLQRGNTKKWGYPQGNVDIVNKNGHRKAGCSMPFGRWFFEREITPSVNYHIFDGTPNKFSTAIISKCENRNCETHISGKKGRSGNAQIYIQKTFKENRLYGNKAKCLIFLKDRVKVLKKKTNKKLAPADLNHFTAQLSLIKPSLAATPEHFSHILIIQPQPSIRHWDFV